MNYTETIDYLFSQFPMYQRQGKSAYKADLSNSIFLDKITNHPHRNFKTIHIAGSNGKGSVSHMLSAILQSAGYKVGLYTSPHLLDFRERIRVNREMISEDGVIQFVTSYKDKWHEIQPSFFEITVAMAFDFFSKMEVDIAIIETGLGGRLDSTNIISPELSVITNISLDHTAILGHTLEAIASEKAGIIKPNTPVVIGEKQPETEEVFREAANRQNAPLTFASDMIKVEPIDQTFLLNKEEIKTDLPGFYQAKNLATALQAIDTLTLKGYDIEKRQIAEGLANVKSLTGLRGRWETLSTEPLVICDTGHNEAGIKFIVTQLDALKKDKIHMVLGMVNDKDLDSILPFLPKEAIYYFTQPSIFRALAKEELKSISEKYGLNGELFNTPKEALSAAKNNAEANDIVFVGGSTFMVADVL